MKSTIPCTSEYDEALRDRPFPPREVASRSVAPPWSVSGERDQPLGRVGPPRQDHVLDAFEQVGLDVLIDDELAGVDDPHVEPGRIAW